MSLEKKVDKKILEYRKKSYELILKNMDKYIKVNEKNFSLGQEIYVRIERENWRIKLNGELFFGKLDNYLKRYLKANNNLIEEKIIIRRLKNLLKSRDTQKIVGINYYDIFYLKNRIFDWNFFRKRLKKYIKN